MYVPKHMLALKRLNYRYLWLSGGSSLELSHWITLNNTHIKVYEQQRLFWNYNYPNSNIVHCYLFITWLPGSKVKTVLSKQKNHVISKQKKSRLFRKMVIFQYNLYIFVWIQYFLSPSLNRLISEPSYNELSYNEILVLCTINTYKHVQRQIYITFTISNCNVYKPVLYVVSARFNVQTWFIANTHCS